MKSQISQKRHLIGCAMVLIVESKGGYMRNVKMFASAILLCAADVVSAQTYSRTESIAYHDNLSKWVLGQIALVRCNSSVPASTACNGNDDVTSIEYDATYALPLVTKRFGKTTQTLTYDTTSSVVSGQRGTVRTVKDGNNNVITLTSWKSGIPEQVQHPATLDHPVVYEKASVNAHGEIDWVTDENGYKTCYSYDDMGRLASITYPDEENIGHCDIDQSHWKKTTISFSGGYPSARGVPAGHWRQYIDTGSNRKVILFDALWRPLVEQAYDSTNVNATLSEVASRYDSSGRLIFRSYPVRPLTTFNDPALKGVRTEYDALDRVTAVKQDSEAELGVLTTTTQYLAGFKTRVTLPKHQGLNPAVFTETSYMAWDEPTMSLPVSIAQPENVLTTINRDAFGKPLTITRGGGGLNVARNYQYNVYHELCRSVEPEAGATLYGYDAAGNLSWSAPGQSTSATCVDGTTPPTAALTRAARRTYDTRNRLKTLRFSDTRGDQDWYYTPDGLPSRVITVNVPGAVHPENQYGYNKRRNLTTDVQFLPAWYSYSVGYTYNANGHLTRINYPSTDYVDFAPNGLGQPTRASGSEGRVYASGVTYHPNGAIKRFTYGNGMAYCMSPNERQLPRYVKTGSDRDADGCGGNLLDLRYLYDKNGNLAHTDDYILGNWGLQNFSYDNLDRLTHVGYPQLGGNHHMYFTYDSLDNIKTWTHPASGGTTMVRDSLYCYDANNRLQFLRTGATTCTNGAATDYFSYDPQGNVEQKNGNTFDFDYGNRLREVIDVERYRYDAYGRRILAMNFATGVVYSQYGHGGQLLYQNNVRTGENKQIDHIYLGGRLIAQREQPRTPINAPVTVRYLHTDLLGSPTVVTNQAGTQIEQTDYAPYGRQLDATTTVGRDRPGYTGHARDQATGLNYMQQRYYDPVVGRFLSVDPVTAYENPAGAFNRYWYAANNPYKFIDPDGREIRFAPGAPADFLRNVASAIRYLNRAGAATPIGKAHMSKEVIIVQPASNRGDAAMTQYDPRTQTVTWADMGGIEVLNYQTGEPETMSPALALGHEFDHVVNRMEAPDSFRLDSRTPDATYDTQEERNVIEGYERPAAERLGEGQRGDHSGSRIEVKCPTPECK